MLPPAYDQGEMESCSANAVAAAVQFARRAHDKPGDFVPSRLFIYYQARKMERSIYSDAGAQLRDCIEAVKSLGSCPEALWPYDGVAGDDVTGVFPQNARAIIEPPQTVMDEAKKYMTIASAKLPQDASSLESCLANGYPFCFGFTVYDNFKPTTKWLKKPGAGDNITPEAHAVLAVGYDRARRVFRIRNSQGPNNNDHGYFDMDYSYVLDSDLSADFWAIYQTLAFIGEVDREGRTSRSSHRSNRV